jgi:hypothetical protein
MNWAFDRKCDRLAEKYSMRLKIILQRYIGTRGMVHTNIGCCYIKKEISRYDILGKQLQTHDK